MSSRARSSRPVRTNHAKSSSLPRPLGQAAALLLSLALNLGGLLAGTGVAAAPPPAYEQQEVNDEVSQFFADESEDLAALVDRLFRDQGRPNAIIRGEETSAALVVGVRYGRGTLVTKSGERLPVFWQSPSVGFDFGANHAKVFALIYNLPNTSALFQRFPGVDGSAYFLGGASVHYARSNGITVAPMRVGAGMRLGASVGYMHFTRTSTLNPF